MKNKYNKIILNDVFSEQITGEWGTECLNGEKGTKILRTTNFTNDGIINYSEVVERKIDESKIKNKHLKHGDIILEKSGGSDNQPVGRVVYFDNRKKDIYLCNNFTQVLRTDNTKAISKYVFYFMFNYHKQGFTSLLQNKTTGIRNLQVKKYLDTQIFLPPMEEQKKIVDVLDKLNNIIEKRKKQLEKLDELIKSKFIEMFGDPVTNPKKWETKDIADVSEELFAGGDRERDISKTMEGEYKYPIFSNGETNNGLLGYSKTFRVNKKAITISARGTIGLPIIRQAKFTPVVRLITLIPKQCVNIIYLAKILKEQKMQSSGSSQSQLTIPNFSKINIIIPPIELQNKFAEFVKTVEKQKSLINKSLEKLELTLKSLMQKYFNNN